MECGVGITGASPEEVKWDFGRTERSALEVDIVDAQNEKAVMPWHSDVADRQGHTGGIIR